LVVVACSSTVLESDKTRIELPNVADTPQAKTGLDRPTWVVPRRYLAVDRDRLRDYIGHLTGKLLKQVVASVEAQWAKLVRQVRKRSSSTRKHIPQPIHFEDPRRAIVKIGQAKIPPAAQEQPAEQHQLGERRRRGVLRAGEVDHDLLRIPVRQRLAEQPRGLGVREESPAGREFDLPANGAGVSGRHLNTLPAASIIRDHGTQDPRPLAQAAEILP
jgi:hypothetical protein